MSKLKTNEDFFAFSKTISVIPAEDLASLLLSSKIKIPLYIHRFVLRETIYSKVFANALYQTYTDELKFRLRGYQDYSIFMLEKLITEYNLDFDAAKYKEIFFNVLFLNADLYGIKEHFINELDKLKYKYAVDFEAINYQTFNEIFSKIFYEPSGYLDGVRLNILKDVMIHSSTLGDLRGLGEKFGVKVPRRINKNQLVDILAKRFRLSEEERVLLNAKSVLELEIYAKEKGFSISIDLKKSDMVEFIVFSLNLYHVEVEKDNHDYAVPLSVDLDSVKIETVSFVSNDQDIPVLPAEGEKAEPKPEPLSSEKPVEGVVEPVAEPLIAEEEETKEPTITPVVEPKPEVVSEKKPDEILEKKTEPVVEKAVEPEIVPVKAEPKAELEPILKPVPAETSKNFSEEERALLDEKINLIIKKYQKKRRQKTFWTLFWVVIVMAVVGFVGYSYIYYNYLVPGQLPFGIPVFWA